jgi:hypothetical protein
MMTMCVALDPIFSAVFKEASMSMEIFTSGWG